MAPPSVGGTKCPSRIMINRKLDRKREDVKRDFQQSMGRIIDDLFEWFKTELKPMMDNGRGSATIPMEIDDVMEHSIVVDTIQLQLQQSPPKTMPDMVKRRRGRPPKRQPKNVSETVVSNANQDIPVVAPEPNILLPNIDDPIKPSIKRKSSRGRSIRGRKRAKIVLRNSRSLDRKEEEGMGLGSVETSLEDRKDIDFVANNTNQLNRTIPRGANVASRRGRRSRGGRGRVRSQRIQISNKCEPEPLPENLEIQTNQPLTDSLKPNLMERPSTVNEDSSSSNDNSNDDEEDNGQLDDGVCRLIRLDCFETGCNNVSLTKNELHRHMRLIHGKLPYSCLVAGCEYRLKTRKQWIQHVEQLHSTIERGKWICGKCDHPYSTHSALINHSNLEHVRGQFQCGRHGCQFGGPSRSSIFSHQRSCTAKFRCTIDSESCQREFSSSVELRQHKRTHHLTGMASNVKPQISTNSSVPLVLAVKSSSINRNNVSIDQKNDNLKTTIVNPEIPKPEMIPLPPISTIVELHHPSIHTSCDPLQLQVAKPIVEKAQIELNPIETLPSCSLIWRTIRKID
ncbi:hypothetical protein RDWZM_008769 [Blomia tropicalis]|uniref:C2H2-type domain-containing protein n=1 Tax=Blomia tropicalis TaxID=40697 RepID=A0A9Q0M2D4_BLOTA|nr:hypothetical protein RDWZM_008769 [Blomia tropicalis]